MSADPLLALENALTRCAGSVMEEATAGMVRAGLERLDKGFARGVDIHGTRYAPAKDGHRPQMIRSGSLRASYLARIARGSDLTRITFYNVRPYADYLIDGTRNKDGSERMKARQHMPKPQEPPPPDLDAALHRACDKALERYWAGVRL